MLSFELRTEFLAALFNCPIETGCMIKIGNYIILNEILNPQKRQILIRILHCELSSFPPSFFLSPLLNTTCNTPRLNKKYLLLLSLQKKIGQKKKIKPNGEQKTNSRIEKGKCTYGFCALLFYYIGFRSEFNRIFRNQNIIKKIETHQKYKEK